MCRVTPRPHGKDAGVTLVSLTCYGHKTSCGHNMRAAGMPWHDPRVMGQAPVERMSARASAMRRMALP